jgi:hypothetical protein
MTARVLLVAIVLTLLGCAVPQIHYGQLSALDKGMSPEAVNSRFQQPPLSVHTGTSGSRSFDFHKFRMNNGMQTDLYLLAYEENRLLYWGYISEFRRKQDADLNVALGNVLPQILAAK